MQSLHNEFSPLSGEGDGHSHFSLKLLSMNRQVQYATGVCLEVSILHFPHETMTIHMNPS